MIAFTVVLASVIELIDTSIVNVALPHMMGNLGATLDEVAWVVTSYIVANVIVVPMTAWLSARFGRRNYFLVSIIIFTVSSFFCGNASNIWELVLFRFIQGLGGGALLSTSQSILVETFPREQLGLANAMFGLGVVMGPTIGPTLGGYITDNLSWPWIFYVNLPIGAVAALMTLAFIREPRLKRAVDGIDYGGILFLAVGIGSLQILLERGERLDWFSSPLIVSLCITSVISLIAFVLWELAQKHPVVDLRVFRHRSLALGTMFTFILGFGLYSSLFIFPVFVQDLLGFSATQTGLLLMPGGFATALMMPVIAKLLQIRTPPQLLNAIGFLLFFIFSILLGQSSLATGQHQLFWPMILRGLALSCLFVPLTTLALSDLNGAEIAQGTGLTNMMRQLGGSFGIALLATYVQHRSWSNRSLLISHVSLYDPVVRERIQGITHSLIHGGSSTVQAQQQAVGVLNGIVTQQSMLLTYLDAFRVVGYFCLFCIPLLIFLKSKSGQRVSPTSMH
ncbi:MAG TPA: DHA2 family efflux MFS transporter permease subunit [Candidatus Saccharimonadales bacterium]|nr:DHA2 family efflux MFS transporter permease subunit [Candidatus Saccharimonadales bacterium]